MRRESIRAAKSAVCMAAMAWLAGPTARAQEPLPLTGELQVNTFTTGAQAQPKVAMADDGTHVVTWQSPLADGDGEGIRFRKFPGDGSSPFNEGGINQATAGEQRRPAIGMNPSRDFVVVWESEVAGQGIRARRSANGGGTLGAEFAASVTTSTSTQFPAVDRSDEGAFVIVWQLGTAVSFRLFDAAGDPVTGDVEVAADLDNSLRPAVSFLPNGGFVVAFSSGEANALDILAQRFDENGIPIGVALPLETGPEDQSFPALAPLSDGGFAVAWDDDAVGPVVRRFDESGAPASAPQGIAPFGGSVSVAASPEGPFVVAASAGEIVAREFDRLGRPVGGSFTVNATTAGAQGESHVAAGSDRYVVVWGSNPVDGDDVGIVRRLFRFRSVFADDFESGDTNAWSTVSP